MQLHEIRRQLEEWSGASAAPGPEELLPVKFDWQILKPEIDSSYWPTIDSRIALLEAETRRSDEMKKLFQRADQIIANPIYKD